MPETVVEAQSARKMSKQALDARARLEASKGPSEEDLKRQMAQQQAQQREYNFRRDLDVRKVQALEAIAESLHVAYEDKIVAWRKVQEEKAIADQKRIEAEQAQAKADAELLASTEAPQAA
jgi:hypothetical protein